MSPDSPPASEIGADQTPEIKQETPKKRARTWFGMSAKLTSLITASVLLTALSIGTASYFTASKELHTVENGKMALLPSNNFESLAVNKTIVKAGKTIEISPARIAENRRAIIQVITDSDSFTPVRIANNKDNTATGVYLSGNKNAPATFEFETQTAVFVKNDSNEDVTLAGGEQWRA